MPFGLNVKDPPFNAQGTGFPADDYPSFRKALDSMSPPTSDEGQVLYVPKGTYYLSRTLVVDKIVTFLGEGGIKRTASKLEFANDVDGLMIPYAPTAGAPGGATTIVSRLAITQRGGGSGTHHGIRAKARFYLYDGSVSNFSGDGINVTASVHDVPRSNANAWRISNWRSTGNGGHDLYLQGNDTNAGVALMFDGTANGGYAVADLSFLGNTYIGCHAAANGTGAYKTESDTNRSVLLGCYVETPQENKFDQKTFAIGGHIKIRNSHFPAGKGVVDEGRQRSEFRVIGFDSGGDQTTLRLVRGAVNQAWEAVNTHDSRGQGLELAYRVGTTVDNFWVMRHGRKDRRTAIAFSANGASLDPGNTLFRNGIYFQPDRPQQPTTVRTGAWRHQRYASAAPTTGVWKRGDVVWNSKPVVSGTPPNEVIKQGWVCVAESPVTWFELQAPGRTLP